MKFVITTSLGLPWYGGLLKSKSTIHSDYGVWDVSNMTLINFRDAGVICNFLDR